MRASYSSCTVAECRIIWVCVWVLSMLVWPTIAAAYQARLPDDFGVERLKYTPISEKAAVVLEMIARQSQANYTRIRTWSGTYRIQDKQLHKNVDGPLLQALSKASGRDLSGKQVRSILTGSVEFEVDIAADSFFSRFHGKSRVFREAGSRQVLAQVHDGQDSLKAEDGYSVDTLQIQNSIVTSEHFLHMRPDTEYPRFAIRPNAGPRLGRAAFRDPMIDGAGRHLSLVVDPRRLFTTGMESGWDAARRIALTLRTLALDSMPSEDWKTLKNAKPNIDIRRADTPSGSVFRVRMMLHTSPQETMQSVYTFDGRVGFNMTHKEITETTITKTGRRTSSWMNWKYKEYDGIFVPQSVIKVNMDRDTNRLGFQRNLDLQDCVVNGPSHPDGFSYKRLGLQDGERVVDRIESKLYILDNGQLVEVQKVDAGPKQSVKASKSRWKLVMTVNAVVLIALIVFVYFRKRRQVSN